MARLVLAALAVLLLACSAQAQGGLNKTQAAAVTLNSIKPPKLAVKLQFMVDGKVTDLTTCNEQKLGSSCLPKVRAENEADAVLVTYSVLPGFDVNLTDHVSLKVCYSNDSQIDRPWRATNPIIAKSKKCPIFIKKGLKPGEGNATWHPNDLVATAAYFVRAYVQHNSSTTVSYPVAFGDSVGYFQVQAIDSRPTNMKIAAGICAAVGPLMFATYFAIISFKKKNV